MKVTAAIQCRRISQRPYWLAKLKSEASERPGIGVGPVVSAQSA